MKLTPVPAPPEADLLFSVSLILKLGYAMAELLTGAAPQGQVVIKNHKLFFMSRGCYLTSSNPKQLHPVLAMADNEQQYY